MTSVSLDKLADGLLHKVINEEIKRVIANIHDRETPADKSRKIVITLSFDANKDRTEAKISVDTKTKLVDKEIESIHTKIHLTRNGLSNDVIPGQMSLEDFGDKTIVKDDNVIVLSGRGL